MGGRIKGVDLDKMTLAGYTSALTIRRRTRSTAGHSRSMCLTMVFPDDPHGYDRMVIEGLPAGVVVARSTVCGNANR